MAEGGQRPFPGRDLEEENKALRAEIEHLRKILASNGLTSASALTHRHNSDLPAVPNQDERYPGIANVAEFCGQLPPGPGKRRWPDAGAR
jgi:hypothetical protein